MRNLYIVVVSFNGGETLVRLIDSLIKDSGAKIVVVENGSREKFQIPNSKFQIKLINNKKNLGFAKGVNIGIKYALQNNADRILLLNQDVVIEREFIKELINNSADIVSPVIKFKRNDKWVYDYGGKVNWNIGKTYHLESIMSPTSFRAQSRNLSRMRDFNSNKLRDPSASVGMTNVDYVSGCCMMIKRQVFEKIGLFDERFFLYFEDVDFCLRAKKAGFTIGIEPKSVIIHKLVEGKEKSIFQKYHLLRSNTIFINKYLGWRRTFGYCYLLLLTSKIIFDRLLRFRGVLRQS